jgi:hypothetical protein
METFILIYAIGILVFSTILALIAGYYKKHTGIDLLDENVNSNNILSLIAIWPILIVIIVGILIGILLFWVYNNL